MNVTKYRGGTGDIADVGRLRPCKRRGLGTDASVSMKQKIRVSISMQEGARMIRTCWQKLLRWPSCELLRIDHVHTDTIATPPITLVACERDMQ